MDDTPLRPNRVRSPNVTNIALHTDIPSRRQIERLLQAGGPHLVSIYLPTTPITPQAEADRIAFKNLPAEAVDELDAAGAGPAPSAGRSRRR